MVAHACRFVLGEHRVYTMRRLWLVFAGCLLWSAWGQESAARWLQRALRAEQTLTVAGVRLNTFQMGAPTEQIRERFWRRGDQAIRIEVVEPAARQGEVFLYRQGQWLRWRTGEKVAYEIPQMPYLASELLEVASRLMQNGFLNAEFLPDETVAGRSCVVLALRPNRPIPPRGRPVAPGPPPRPGERSDRRFPLQAKLWIDRETGLVLKREMQIRPADGVIRTEVVRVDFSPRLSNDLFRLPEGVEVRKLAELAYRSIEEAQRAAGFPIRLPGYLPPNTERQQILVHRRKPQENPLVAIRYTSPLGRFTLFQTYKPRSSAPPRPPKGRVRAYFWQDGDYWFGIVGDLPQEEMEKIARSMGR